MRPVVEHRSARCVARNKQKLPCGAWMPFRAPQTQGDFEMIMDLLHMLDGTNSAAGVFTGTTVNSGTTFTVGNQVSANIIDMSQIASSAKGLGRDIAVGDDIELVSLVIVTFTGSSSTMQLQVQYAPDNGSGSPGSYVT